MYLSVMTFILMVNMWKQGHGLPQNYGQFVDDHFILQENQNTELKILHIVCLHTFIVIKCCLLKY